MRFDAAISTTSWTLPSHAALFTGLFDVTHGVVRNGLALDAGHVTLAETLRDAGYHTAGFFGGPYLHPTFGLAQGFDVYRSCMTALPDDAPDAEVRRRARQARAAPSHADVTGPRTRDEILRWLDGVPDQPVFLFIHLWDVHYDYIPPPEYLALFDPDYEGSLDPSDMARSPAIHKDMDPRDLEHLIARYDGEIRFSDDVLGAILERFDAVRGLDDAVLVVTSDHGQEFFEHGGKGHQRTLFDEVVRVPLIVRAPGRADAGRAVESQVRLIDVMPTVLALADVPAPAGLEGRDLSPLLRGEPLPPAPALLDLSVDRRVLYGLRRDDAKVVVSSQGQFGYWDLAEDPGEERVLGHTDPRVGEALAELQARRQQSLVRREELAAGEAPRARVEPEVRRKLESLGYVEEGAP